MTLRKPPLLRYIGALILFCLAPRAISAHPRPFIDTLFPSHEVNKTKAHLIQRQLEHILFLSEPFKLKNNLYLKVENNPRSVQSRPGELTVTLDKKIRIPNAEKALSPEMILNLTALGQALFDSEILNNGFEVSRTYQSYYKIVKAQQNLRLAEHEYNKNFKLFSNAPGKPEDNDDLIANLTIAKEERSRHLKTLDGFLQNNELMNSYDLANHVMQLFRKLFAELYAASFAEHGQALLNIKTLDINRGQRNGLVDLEDSFRNPNRFLILTDSDNFFKQTRSRIWQNELRNRSLRDRIYFLHELFQRMKVEIADIFQLTDSYLATMEFTKIPFPNYFLLFQVKLKPNEIGHRLSAPSLLHCDSELIPADIDS
ncbi:MAG: hypothetical protein KA116_02465 [Proteobacteria bacterium]|nr:hypothetical protein [Pseudomonadota bacterium]